MELSWGFASVSVGCQSLMSFTCTVLNFSLFLYKCFGECAEHTYQGDSVLTGSRMTIYHCKGCNRCLNLSDEYLYPPNAYFDAGNKGTLSFSAVDKTEFRQKEQNQCFPFFETVDYWGIQRRRTKLMCAACGKRLGYIYNDGPYADAGIGQGGFGHSQMIPRHPRYRLKRDAILISG
ncbi:hypothetical protein M758_1G287400 [Ceratodon purpureus]|uniref:Uncharacterized protein n=1 Tax=Ceratodon purpureus TaxID=3225 RepID=A0A8T0JBZ5_CERPU|nr:hypothetical protein KC19_1G295700 [Ceratodon purpureus]KAG0631891.1 hypothetical protein M758_1G287400 [Ceratodon purpureus]